MNKKGVEINITTIIIVILAILVLVILSLYFTGGMKNLWQKISGVSGAWNEADMTSARQACVTYCGFDEFTFCTQKFDIRKGNETLTKYCNEDPVNAHRTPECKEWYSKIDCSVHRTAE
jgi:hypothetical protein